tara:strand:- start:1620 stop:1823 length:204 start_codon:yes stop_codon:yes gene_type:complete
MSKKLLLPTLSVIIFYLTIGISLGVLDNSSIFTRMDCKDSHLYNRVMTYTGLKYVHKLGCFLGEIVE